ncbi:MAG: hypothetical protein HY910_04240 [Desulfarculus sp.]|nr:hypothetical protein [Desulfarculus sp.]
MEAEKSWGNVVRVWWAYAWRSFLMMIVAFIIHLVLNLIIVIVGNSFELPPRLVTGFDFLVKCAVFLSLSIVPMRLIMGKDFGHFRLVMLTKEPPAPVAGQASPTPQA